MATSQNGWPALTTKPRGVLKVAGVEFVGGVADNADVILVLGYVATQFHKRVEPLHNPGCWGWSYRANRNNAASLSNHARGIAIDVNAPKHPNGVATAKTFTAAQIAEVHKILAEVDHAVRWGGDYVHTVDAMHFEINVTPAVLAVTAARLRKKTPVAPQKAPKKTPKRFARFVHLDPYSLNDSVAGLHWGRARGYTDIDLDFHIDADGEWENQHWGDFRDRYIAGKRVKGRHIKTTPSSLIRKMRDKKGRKIHTAAYMLKTAKKLGYRRVEIEPKDVPTVAQFRELKAIAEKVGIEIVVKRLTNIPGAVKCLAHAHAAGIHTMALPRGTRRLRKSDYWPVTTYVRGSVRWV